MGDESRRLPRRQRAVDRLEETTFLSVQRTAGLWMQALAQRLRSVGLTPTQYNVLRILRGVGSDSLTCGEIGERMVNPVPDVTRLVDRLVARQLARKARDEADRRVVRVEITPAGLELLDALDERVLGWLGELLEPLGEEEMRQLCHLLEQTGRRDGK